jgi:hypothetical protein
MIKRGKAPKGWHIAKGRELHRIERSMIRKGLMSKRRAPTGTIPDPKTWCQVVVKDKA